MHAIHILDQTTIDRIAAGEVVERPASVVKELVENALDAGATRITVEIRGGGIDFLRVTDNGSGIAREDLPYAFLRHATSKIGDASDLISLSSLGFRGEALSSIAAVSRVELITKRAEDITASRYLIEGGREKALEEIGAPDGTSFVMRDLFYNTPARGKFLKSAQTEGAHIGAIVEQLILSNTGVAFTYIVNGQTKLSSSGSGKLEEAVYHVYGRALHGLVLPILAREDGLELQGLIGKPQLSRGNRNFENYYVNGRYVKSRVLMRAIEDGYGTKLMQHQYPFVCFSLTIRPEAVDVNVHPTKMDVRFSDEKLVYAFVREAVERTLRGPDLTLDAAKLSVLQGTHRKKSEGEVNRESRAKVSGDLLPAGSGAEQEQASGDLAPAKFSGGGATVIGETPPAAFSAGQEQAPGGLASAKSGEKKETAAGETSPAACIAEQGQAESEPLPSAAGNAAAKKKKPPRPAEPFELHAGEAEARLAEALGEQTEKPVFEQQTFVPRFLSKEAKPLRRIVGQIFDTYWIAEYEGKVFVFDQHAAHERVLFETFMKQYEKREISSQLLSPPGIVTLDAREEQLLLDYMDAFTGLGFEIEHFGERDYAIRAVPYALGNIGSDELFRDLLDQLETGPQLTDLHRYIRRVATEACKAAVKGGGRLSTAEAEQLLDDLMRCEDPYHCPHGRPTILSFSRQDVERRFKRIV